MSATCIRRENLIDREGESRAFEGLLVVSIGQAHEGRTPPGIARVLARMEPQLGSRERVRSEDLKSHGHAMTVAIRAVPILAPCVGVLQTEREVREGLHIKLADA